MRKNNRYISGRIVVCGAAAEVAVWIIWIIALGMALESKQSIVPVVIYGLIFISINLLIVFWIVLPYHKLKKNITLFLEGYTAEGLKNQECTLSPDIEQLILIMLHLIESDRQLSSNKRQAQYLALQNQINPHFLYNTLESIRSEAMEAGIENVTNMTEALASYFRYTISKVENMVTVEEELQNIETYFYIQKYRFEERLHLKIEYEEEDRDILFKCLLPKLTLQPIVENSIIHGIEQKLGEGTVRIILKCTEKRLIIQISDDGVGMKREILDKLNQQLNQPVLESIYLSKSKGGIAIVNVNNRIHLIFGEEYGMSLYSVPGVGTDMIINLPLVTSKRQYENGKMI